MTNQEPADHRTEPEARESKPWRTEGLGDVEGTGIEPPKKPSWGRIIVWGLVFYLISYLVLSAIGSFAEAPTISYSEFTRQVQAGNVEAVYSKGDTIQGVLKEPATIPDTDATYQGFKTERPTFADDDLFRQLVEGGAMVSAEPLVTESNPLATLLIAFGPMILLLLLYWWGIRRMRKMAGQGGMGALGALGMGGKKVKPIDPEAVRVTFDDVAGIDEVKGQVTEIVDFLKNPDKYTKLGAKAPGGVLLSGEPGTGKTLLARATAGEADVPFFSASASEFIEMVVGVGAQRVRDLFKEARAVAPSIIFIDEIDTIGRSRGGSNAMGGHDEREQTLNQILTEMDGFDGSEGVVVMAATNRADVLDKALTRPGRFDRHITVHAPDVNGREAILGVHARGVATGPDVDLAALARVTPGMTGAALANLINEGAILAAREGSEVVTQAHLMTALEKVQLGVERSVLIPEEERRRTAYHEAGHALVGMLQEGADPVRRISIIPRGQALGVTVSSPEEDRYGYDETYLRGRIMGALGGWAAEQLVLGVTTTGVDSDLETATNIARNMVGRWGMSPEVGAMTILSRDGDPRMLGIAESTLTSVDEAARRIIQECQVEAVELLRNNRDKLDAIVEALMEHETLDEAQSYAAAGIRREVTPA